MIRPDCEWCIFERNDRGGMRFNSETNKESCFRGSETVKSSDRWKHEDRKETHATFCPLKNLIP